jgi:hypothetical protein
MVSTIYFVQIGKYFSRPPQNDYITLQQLLRLTCIQPRSVLDESRYMGRQWSWYILKLRSGYLFYNTASTWGLVSKKALEVTLQEADAVYFESPVQVFILQHCINSHITSHQVKKLVTNRTSVGQGRRGTF